MTSFLKRLREADTIIADGAVGTMLLSRGLGPGDCPERLNLERPEMLEEIARLYLDAGAEIIQTNTFGGSPLKLSVYSLDNYTEQINANAVRAVRKSAGSRAYVSASCGPTGKLLEPAGDTSFDSVYTAYRRQMKILIDEGVDLICIETMTDLNEAVLAVSAAKSVSSSIPVCATMTFDKTPKGFYTIMGVSVAQAVSALAKAGAGVLGSNCGNGIAGMIEIAKEFHACTTVPLMIRPNAGIPSLKNGILVYPESPGFMSEKCRELIEAGVRIIGGCCGTTPEHINAMNKVVRP